MTSPSWCCEKWCSEKQSTRLPRQHEPHFAVTLPHLILCSPGESTALDCEIVGVGTKGNESSLACVSIVNYTGAFVRQREKVVDYPTRGAVSTAQIWLTRVRVSSASRSTQVGLTLPFIAKPFREAQQTVVDLIEGRVLVGHAIFNDLKVCTSSI